jgi:hypothetical protein
VICAESSSLTGIMIGRGIQGLGAISAAITALVADSTVKSTAPKRWR